jgi:dihydroorotate dehydrogenase (fumarate)
LLSGRAGCDLSASQGVLDAEAALKLLLVGATTIQLCSAVLMHGPGRITAILRAVVQWMEEHGYSEIGRFRGLLTQANSSAPWEYEETQYR